MEDQKRKKSFTLDEIEQGKEKHEYAPVELGTEIGNSFMKAVYEAVETARKEWHDRSFYVEFFFKRERLDNEMLRMKPIGRSTCPTPEFNHAAIFYRKEDDTIHLLWILPDEATCKSMILSYNDLNEEQKSLIPYIVGKLDGSLLQMVRKQNNENPKNEGIMLVKEEAEG